MALARLEHSRRRSCTAAPSCTACLRRHGRSPIQDVFEAVGAHGAGRIDDAELRRSRTQRLPRRRRLRRPVHRQHDGDGADLPRPVAAGLERHPRDRSPTSRRRAARAASWCMQRCARRAVPRDILTPTALRNAARIGLGDAGSTNAVLHLLAIAHEAGVAFDLEEFEAASAHAGDRRPEAGRPLHRERKCPQPAARALVARELRAAGLIEDAPTVTGRTLFEELDAAAPAPPTGRRAFRSRIRSSRAAATRSCTAISRRKAASLKLAGHGRTHFEGTGARVRSRGSRVRRGAGAARSTPATWS